MCEGNVVDPVRVRVRLGAEAGGRGFGLCAVVGGVFSEVEVEVPGAYYAVATTGVSVVAVWSAADLCSVCLFACCG